MRFATILLTCSCIIFGSAAAVAASEPKAAEILSRLAASHGGMQKWSALKTISVSREHQPRRIEQPWRFHILADYPTHRNYQQWTNPAGVLAWDGERAWSVDWPLAGRLTPRFVTSIGFYLVNMPWFAQDSSARVLSLTRRSDLPGYPQRSMFVLDVQFEGDMVRKPRGFAGPRDHFMIYVDPESYQLKGVKQFRTHAGQLDAFGASVDEDAFVEVYVPKTQVNIEGLLWPGEYDIYNPEGVLTAAGRFFDYAFDQAMDATQFAPPANAVFDNASTWQRQSPETTAAH